MAQLSPRTFERVRAVWARLLGLGADGFPTGEVRTLRRPALSVRVVAIAGGTVVVAPGAAADRVRAGVPPDRLCDRATVAACLGPLVREHIGSAELAYADSATLRPPARSTPASAVIPVSSRDARLGELHDACASREWLESGIAEMEPRFVVEDTTGTLAAVAGYRVWSGRIAHLGVLAHPAARGRGYARAVASHAAHHALARGLVPQWRAAPSNEASRGLGGALGFVPIGAQLTFTLWAAPPPE